MSENKLEKATFIKLYGHDFDICNLTRDKPGSLPGVNRESSVVIAHFGALYCAETGVLLIERKGSNSAYWRLDWLPKKTLETVGGLGISQAVDTIYEKAREWRDEVNHIVSENAPNFDVTPIAEAKPARADDGDGDGESFGAEVFDAVAAQINTGALNGNGVAVTASVSKARRGKRG